MSRRGGIISLKVDGEMYEVKGSFTVNLGRPQRTAINGSDGRTHGFTEAAQVPFIEGMATDRASFDLDKLTRFSGGTVTLESATGKVYILSGAWYAGDGNLTTEEGEITIRFEGIDCEEV